MRQLMCELKQIKGTQNNRVMVETVSNIETGHR